jgi:hypothetical protein
MNELNTFRSDQFPLPVAAHMREHMSIRKSHAFSA